jgi:KDO2-lipid IV(A) lauroyltransferase
MEISIAKIALRYDIDLIPVRCIRIGREFKFDAKVEKPLFIEKSADTTADIENLTLKINQTLERWITEYPSQWFWVHNRWKT